MQKVHLVVKISKIHVAIYFLYRSIITVIYILFYFFKTVERNFWMLEADSFFLLKWHVFNSNEFFLVKLTLSRLN